MKTKAIKIFDCILGGSGGLVSAIMLALMLSIDGEIVMRYFLNRPLEWEVEVAEIMLFYSCFLGAGWVLKREGHIVVDFVLANLKPRARSLLIAINSFIGIIISSVIVGYSVQFTWDHQVRHLSQVSALGTPDIYIYWVVPLGSLLLLLQFIRRTYTNLSNWRASGKG